MLRITIVIRTLLMTLIALICVIPAGSNADPLALSGLTREYDRAGQALISGEPSWAEWHYRNVLLYAELAGVRDERVARSCYEVAMIRLSDSDLVGAHRMIRRAYQTRRELLGGEHPDVGRTGRVLMRIEARIAEARQTRIRSRASTWTSPVAVASR